jgi:hypothetical protein
MTPMPQYDAPAGSVWVCGACGKRSGNRANGTIDRGWDESCFLNSLLCVEASVRLDKSGRVEHADALEEQPK